MSPRQGGLEAELDAILDVDLPLGILGQIIEEWVNATVKLKLLNRLREATDGINRAFWTVTGDNGGGDTGSREHNDGRGIALED